MGTKPMGSICDTGAPQDECCCGNYCALASGQPAGGTGVCQRDDGMVTGGDGGRTREILHTPHTRVPETGVGKAKTYSTEEDDPNYSEFTPSIATNIGSQMGGFPPRPTIARHGIRRRRRRNEYFQFKQSCRSQASFLRFGSPMEERAWMRKCMAKHLHKQEERILPTDVARPTTTPQGYRIGTPCSVNNREGYNVFRCLGAYDREGKCSPCEDDVLPRPTSLSRKTILNQSDIKWNYPSRVFGRNYEGIRRGFRGKLFGWNLGMGKAQLKERLFSDNPHKYDWGYGG